MSPLARLPLELLEKIALDVSDDGPAALGPLLLVSTHFYASLGPASNPHLYARLFRRSFDATAPARRLGDLTPHGLAAQLRANHAALRTLRRRDIHAPDLVSTFWTCFSMLLENDGKNRAQLNSAGLPDFVDAFVRERLYENAVDGWPPEDEVNSLALWLLWLTTTEDRLRAESPAQRAQMTRLILPYVLMPVRFAAYLAPHIHYTLPLPRDLPQIHSIPTQHGPYPHYRCGFSRSMSLYHVKIKLSVPLASIPAKLIYFSHREVLPVGVPLHLPLTRAHAIQLGFNMVGPTQEDVRELNEHKIAKFVPQSRWDWWSDIDPTESLSPHELAKCAPSACWDDDWNRLADCISLSTPVSIKRTHYTPGLLCGLWQGRMVYPDDIMHGNVIQTRQMPASFSEQTVGLTATPVFMRLREYHCMDVHPNEPVASGSIQNAWFHSSMRYQEVPHGLAIACQDRILTYDEYVVGGPDLHDESKCRGCEERGTSEMIFRENDIRLLNNVIDEIMDDAEEVDDDELMDDNESGDDDVDMAPGGNELELTRKCDGILDIVLVGETDVRHGQAWQHYKFYGRVREWDGLVALIRVPAHPQPMSAALGTWVFTGYVVGGQNFVGNWRARSHPGEPITFESAFAMSKRE